MVAVFHLERTDIGQQPALADLQLDLAADLAGQSDARIGIARQFAQPLAGDADFRTAALKSRSPSRSDHDAVPVMA
jgi:hypothetical protein